MDFTSQSQEQRKHCRVAVDIPVILRSMNNRQPQMWNMICQDISEGGMKVSSFQFFPASERVVAELIVSQYGQPVRSVGQVMWVERIPYQERYTIGIAFSDLAAADRDVMRRAVQTRAALSQ